MPWPRAAATVRAHHRSRLQQVTNVAHGGSTISPGKDGRPRSPLLRWVLCARRLRLRALHRDSRDQRRVDSDRAHRCGTTRRTQRSHSARQDLVEKGGVVPQMLVLIVG